RARARARPRRRDVLGVLGGRRRRAAANPLRGAARAGPDRALTGLAVLQDQARVAELVAEIARLARVGERPVEQGPRREGLQQLEVALPRLVEPGQQPRDDAGTEPRADLQLGAVPPRAQATFPESTFDRAYDGRTDGDDAPASGRGALQGGDRGLRNERQLRQQ